MANSLDSAPRPLGNYLVLSVPSIWRFAACPPHPHADRFFSKQLCRHVNRNVAGPLWHFSRFSCLLFFFFLGVRPLARARLSLCLLSLSRPRQRTTGARRLPRMRQDGTRQDVPRGREGVNIRRHAVTCLLEHPFWWLLLVVSSSSYRGNRGPKIRFGRYPVVPSVLYVCVLCDFVIFFFASPRG